MKNTSTSRQTGLSKQKSSFSHLFLTKWVGILFISTALITTSGCSLFRKKDAATTDSGIKSEQTASGGSENLDSTPLNMAVTGSDSGTIEGLKTVFFEYDKSTLTGSEKDKLMGNVGWIKKNSGTKITVEGHCDQRGSAEYNLALGERRANTVKQMLISNGIPSNRITTVSFGKEKLLNQDDSEEAMKKNRRANFVPVR